MKSKVIVISGVTASGKTTLVNKLHKMYPQSKVISFDDYDIDQLPSTPAIEVPLKDAINQYDISQMMQDLKQIEGQTPLIWVDFPFGYCHNALRPDIDKVVYLQTPLDVAFARAIIRDDQAKTTAEIISWIKIYLNEARQYFVDNQELVAKDADLVLDGMQSVAEEVAQVNRLIM